MKKKLLFIPLLGMLLSGCSLEDLMFWQQKVDEQQQSTEDNGGSEPLTSNEYTAKVYTSGQAISGYAKSSGVQVDTDLLSGSKNAENLTNCLKAQLQHQECLTSTWFAKVNSAVWGDETMVQIGTGSPAKNNFNSGTFKWESSAPIYKVELEIQAYGKLVDSAYGNNSVDTTSHVLIDEDDHSLEVASFEELAFQKVSKTYENGAFSFEVISKSGRVILKSIEITWVLP